MKTQRLQPVNLVARVSVLATTVFLCLTLQYQAQGHSPFSVSASATESAAGQANVSVIVTVPPHHYLYADQLKVTAAAPILISEKDRPTPVRKRDPFLETETNVYDRTVQLQYEVHYPPGQTIEFTIDLQGCSETLCFLPETRKFVLRPGGTIAHAAQEHPLPLQTPANALESTADPLAGFSLVGRVGGYLSPTAFLAFLDGVESGKGLAEDSISASFRSQRVWLALLLVLLGGAALNLTPCVLPMIPINLLIIGAGASAGSRWRGLLLGATYGAGITIAYGVLGLLVVLTGTRFGALNASPWFNLAVASVFLVMALALFGVFRIDFSRLLGSASVNVARRRGFPVAFFAGAAAALLGGACVAPVVISVLVLAADLYSKGNPTGILLPFLLGLGMALPWPLAGAGLSFLPKPGKWSKFVGVAFGLVILALAINSGYLGVRLLHQTAPKMLYEKAAAEGWLTSLEEAATRARKEQKQLLVDFWASWCKSCHAMDATTFQDERVRARLTSYVRLKYRAENPSHPQTRQLLERVGAIGLPTYAVLRPPAAADPMPQQLRTSGE